MSKYIGVIAIALLTTSCVLTTKLSPQQSIEIKKYIELAEQYYQATVEQYDELNQLLDESIKDIRKAEKFHWSALETPVDAAKQDPKITSEQLVLLMVPPLKERDKTLASMRERQEIMQLKRGEGEISYRKAVEFHDKAAKIARVRGTYGNADISEAQKHELEKWDAHNSAVQLELQANSYWDYVTSSSILNNKNKTGKDMKEVLTYFGKFFPTREEAFIKYKEGIKHLKEEIKHRRKEFERIKKKLQ